MNGQKFQVIKKTLENWYQNDNHKNKNTTCDHYIKVKKELSIKVVFVIPYLIFIK